MKPAEGIRKLGFRRWYERQLIEGHAWFVTCFLCMIVVAASMETLNLRAPDWEALGTLAAVLGGAAFGFFSLARYKTILDRAEYIAEHSTCTACATYGRIQVTQSGRDDGPAPGTIAGAGPNADVPWLRVRCRKCGHEWLIDPYPPPAKKD